jgi:tRNA pseudouridine synthase 10
MFLCEICNAANGSAFDDGECHICGGKALETPGMIEEAAGLLSKEQAKSFSISTKIPKDWLVREEDAWDISMRKTESLKSMLNGTIVKALRERSSLPYVMDGDVRLVFDYKKGEVELERNDLFIFGRYMKHTPGLSQSRWLCAKCQGKGCNKCGGKGKNYESVEERIGEPVKKVTKAKDYVLHASGREDVDATNSAGRAFVLEVKGPGSRELDLTKLAEEIAATGEVSVICLKIVPRRFTEVVTESHFDKSYKTGVEFGRELTEEDKSKIEGIAGKTLLQRTPKRVAHRRADLVRQRKVKEFEVLESEGNRAVLRIKAEAGTYIKELISSDEGRTEPSIAGLLSTEARCTSLDVSDIDDGFLDFCLRD